MKPESIYNQPDADGFFGRYGGSFISETLAQAVEELQQAYRRLTVQINQRRTVGPGAQ